MGSKLGRKYGTFMDETHAQMEQQEHELIQTETRLDLKCPKNLPNTSPGLPLSVTLAMLFSLLWRPTRPGYNAKDSTAGNCDVGYESENERSSYQLSSHSNTNRRYLQRASREGNTSIAAKSTYSVDESDVNVGKTTTSHASHHPHHGEQRTNEVLIGVEDSQDPAAVSTETLHDPCDVDFIGDVESTNVNQRVPDSSVNPCIEILFVIPLLFHFVSWTRTYMNLLYIDLGDEELLFFTTDFVSFTIHLYSVISLALYARIRTCCQRRNSTSRRSILQIFDMHQVRQYTIEMHRCVRGRQSVRIQHFMPFLFPFINTIFKIAYDVFLSPPMCQKSVHNFIRIQIAVCYISYGGFWYIIYINRMALHCRLNEGIRWIIGAASSNDLDQARRLINRLYTDFHVLRKFTGIWMAIMMFATTVQTACRVIYTSIEMRHLAGAGSESDRILIGDMIDAWLGIVIYYVLPLKALGGLNIEYMWRRFHLAIVKSKEETHSHFFEGVLHHVKDIDRLGTPLLSWTLAFSVIGLLLPILLKLNFQDDSPWRYRYPYHQCANETYASIITVAI